MFPGGSRKTVLALWTVASFFRSLCSADKPTPTAVSVPVRTDWLGDDGFWSPVSIQVGTPPQWVNVFVSTASQETWVVGTGGCDGTDICSRDRGGIFSSANSTTWSEQGVSDLGLDPDLGFGGNGTYGFDSISLNDKISTPAQIVAVINTTEYWVGFLGLGIMPTNFSGPNVPTFLDNMVVNKSYIPSHSYGYTAGAYYSKFSVNL